MEFLFLLQWCYLFVGHFSNVEMQGLLPFGGSFFCIKFLKQCILCICICNILPCYLFYGVGTVNATFGFIPITPP